jgi:hypothetical protein
MRLRSLARRRPSAALGVSFLALFVALGGAGWAALRIPPNSVGNAQLRNFSVGNRKLRPNSVGPTKIVPGAVGARQVNSSQVQLRLTGSCSEGAIQSIAALGNVACTPVLPNEYGTKPGPTVTLGNDSTQVSALALPATPDGSSYLVFATAHANLTENATGTQAVIVECGLALGAGTGSSGAVLGDFTTELDAANSGSSSGTIPFVAPIAVASTSSTVTLNCAELPEGGAAAPTVTVGGTINAIQTASNN